MCYFLAFMAFIAISFNPLAHVEGQTPRELASDNQVFIMEENAQPEYLYKIISEEEWQASLLSNTIVLSPIDQEFIHLATEEQIAHVAQKFWKNRNHIILKLSANELVGRLVYEANPGGSSKYYHLYDGRIPLDAVADVTLVQIKPS